MSDMQRLPDSSILFDFLPAGTAIVLRHTDSKALALLARRILPKARVRHLKVLISNDVCLARQLGADGVHLSEAIFRMGQWRRTIASTPPNFIFTAAHHRLPTTGLRNIDAILMSPVFITESHPRTQSLGVLKFANIVRRTPRPVIALGGITARNIKHIKMCHAFGVAAIGAWQSNNS